MNTDLDTWRINLLWALTGDRLRTPREHHNTPIKDHNSMNPPAPPTTAHIIAALRELADDIDSTIADTTKRMGRYRLAEHGVPYIIEYQLDRRDIGSESRLLRHAADALASRTDA